MEGTSETLAPEGALDFNVRKELIELSYIV
jgi:hypothetical protein